MMQLRSLCCFSGVNVSINVRVNAGCQCEYTLTRFHVTLKNNGTLKYFANSTECMLTMGWNMILYFFNVYNEATLSLACDYSF